LPFLFIDLQMFENLSDHLVLADEADDPHLARTFRTGERLDLPHLLDACPPHQRGDATGSWFSRVAARGLPGSATIDSPIL